MTGVLTCALPIYIYIIVSIYFFFQVEDGIRDKHVTGVQTFAIPIFFFVISVSQHTVENSPAGMVGQNVSYNNIIHSLCGTQ